MGKLYDAISLVFTAIAFLSSLISYFIPFWLKEKNSFYGLWAKCQKSEMRINELNCDWFWENDFRIARSMPVWWQATMGLLGVGVIVLFFSFLMGLSAACCCRGAKRSSQFIAALLGFACLLHIASIGTFYATARERKGVVFEVLSHGYWMAVAAMIFSFFAFLCYLVDACRTNYQRLREKEEQFN